MIEPPRGQAVVCLHSYGTPDGPAELEAIFVAQREVGVGTPARKVRLTVSQRAVLVRFSTCLSGTMNHARPSDLTSLVRRGLLELVSQGSWAGDTYAITAAGKLAIGVR
jgi:hypothetical protein